MKILFISHDYTRTGAPIALLRLMNSLCNTNITMYVDFIYERGDYSIRKKFIEVAKFTNELNSKVFFKRSQHFDLVFVNTIVGGEVLEKIRRNSSHIITWIHEMEFTINQYGFMLANDIAHYSDEVWGVNQYIVDYFEKLGNKTILFTGTCDISDNIYKRNISDNIKLLKVLASGQPSWRKGIFDIPIMVKELQNVLEKIVWYGGDENNKLLQQISYQVQLHGLSAKFEIGGIVEDFPEHLKDYHVFILLSHEDPFPLVCLEAASAGLPIICWDKGNGITKFVNDDAGWVVEYQNYDALKSVFEEILSNPDLLRQKGEVARQRVLREYTSEIRAKQFLELIGYQK